MNKYDYIFCPSPTANGEWTVEGMDLEHECVEHVIGPIIVLTIEEAIDIFRNGTLHGIDPDDTRDTAEAAKIYLKSKGIEL